ncbi:DUF397 domain-containing protein [Glycomyces buryatensis]|uniref:DUF397 domain-containing protein n=1 Tax=Glycomyces buryatensis TaxID=2570927 RepID=A0A4S8QPT2_9ACTN|nr:DUF397 domain-containing protein [Glycomyces buryatensis]THV42724.1 DUF397 domain-containing protein [Glycomyces buryatensis]
MTAWRKSSRSGANNNCVEARTEGDGFQVRDSKLGDGSPIFALKTSDFTSLLAIAKGE